MRHFDPAVWQDECETTVFRGNLAKFSQNEEMRVALEHTGARRIAEASPLDKVWGIGLDASDPRAASPKSWCGLNLSGHALERTREILRQNTYGGTQLHTPVSTDCAADDTVFEIDPITHVRLNKPCLNSTTHPAQLSVFTDSVPDDHAPEVLWLLPHAHQLLPCLNKAPTWSAAS